MHPLGTSRKYWDVPAEILYEEIGLSIGAAFVLGQATITQTISILNKIRTLSTVASSLLPGKSAILNFQASIDAASGLSHPYIIDLASNYFKHHPEWPNNWSTATFGGQQARTIQGCVAIGMEPGEVTDNMFMALKAITIPNHGVESIQLCLENWRSGIARDLYATLGLVDPTLMAPPDSEEA